MLTPDQEESLNKAGDNWRQECAVFSGKYLNFSYALSREEQLTRITQKIALLKKNAKAIKIRDYMTDEGIDHDAYFDSVMDLCRKATQLSKAYHAYLHKYYLHGYFFMNGTDANQMQKIKAEIEALRIEIFNRLGPNWIDELTTP